MMKKNSLFLAVLVLTSLFSSFAQDAMLAYQGRMTFNGAPLNGKCDLSFSLYKNGSDSVPVEQVTNSSIMVSNGLFFTTFDLTQGIFSDSGTNWLQVAMRAEANADFNVFAPKLQLSRISTQLSPVSTNHIISHIAPIESLLNGNIFANQLNSTNGSVTASISGNVWQFAFVNPPSRLGTTAGSIQEVALTQLTSELDDTNGEVVQIQYNADNVIANSTVKLKNGKTFNYSLISNSDNFTCGVSSVNGKGVLRVETIINPNAKTLQFSIGSIQQKTALTFVLFGPDGVVNRDTNKIRIIVSLTKLVDGVWTNAHESGFYDLNETKFSFTNVIENNTFVFEKIFASDLNQLLPLTQAVGSAMYSDGFSRTLTYHPNISPTIKVTLARLVCGTAAGGIAGGGRWAGGATGTALAGPPGGVVGAWAGGAVGTGLAAVFTPWCLQKLTPPTDPTDPTSLNSPTNNPQLESSPTNNPPNSSSEVNSSNPDTGGDAYNAPGFAEAICGQLPQLPDHSR